jgi:parvulin-like peptidyl-prolyl isomerase
VVLALGAAALAVLACARERLTARDAVARLGEAEVRYPEVEAYFKQSVGEVGPALGSDVLSRLFDQFLEERLLIELARARGLAAGGASALGASEALLAAEPPPAPAEAEVGTYYAAHPAEFMLPERLELRQILVEDREAAEQVRAELAAGVDFTTVAARFARDRGAVAGLAGSELGRDDLPPAIAEVVFRLRPGETSRVVQADYGFHVFQLVARHAPRVVPLEEAAAEIRAALARRAADARLEQLVAEARTRYDVEVYARNLPFNYQGAFPVADFPG